MLPLIQVHAAGVAGLAENRSDGFEGFTVRGGGIGLDERVAQQHFERRHARIFN